MSTNKFKIVFFEITNTCNLNCSFCPIGVMKRKKSFIAKEKAFYILDQIAEQKISKYVALHIMGEPMIHPNFVEIVKYANDLGIDLLLCTNGLELGKAINQFVISNFKAIFVSLRHPNRSLFENSVHSKKYTFSKYMDGIQDLIEIQRLGFEEVKIYLRIFNNKLYDKLIFNKKFHQYIQTSYNISSIFDNLEIDLKSNKNIEVSFQRLNDSWLDPLGFEAKIYPGVIGSCDGLKSHFGILVDGTVIPCVFDFEGENNLGNIFENSIESILSSKKVKNFRVQLDQFILPTSKCKECKGGHTRAVWASKQFKGILQKYKILKIPQIEP